MRSPDYVAQNAEPMSIIERGRWFERCAEEARARGCTGGRATIHSILDYSLYEGWKDMPDVLPEPEWQLTEVTDAV